MLRLCKEIPLSLENKHCYVYGKVYNICNLPSNGSEKYYTYIYVCLFTLCVCPYVSTKVKRGNEKANGAECLQ